MRISEIKCKTILTPAKWGGFTLNPYIGCTHNCLYCYATYIGKWKHPGWAWGSWVDVKINAPEILEKELKKYKAGEIFISTVCDAYQPIEKRYKITQRCLKQIVQKTYHRPTHHPKRKLINAMAKIGDRENENGNESGKWKVSLLTKSDLVLRDIDLIKKIPQIEIGFSITTLDDQLASIFEPYSSRPSKRIDALKRLKDEGIKTRVAINPILPYFTEENLEEMINFFSKIGVDSLAFDNLHYIEGRVGERLRPVYQRFGKLEELEKGKFSSFCLKLREKIEKIMEKIKIPYEIYF